MHEISIPRFGVTTTVNPLDEGGGAVLFSFNIKLKGGMPGTGFTDTVKAIWSFEDEEKKFCWTHVNLQVN